jgi:formylglycine-generating enzyme required for sulfatase activity
MGGNVFEWTGTMLQGYPYAWHEVGEAAKLEQKGVIMRGGYFGSDASWLRCSFRSWNLPYSHLRDLGFRVVLGPPFSTSGR